MLTNVKTPFSESPRWFAYVPKDAGKIPYIDDSQLASGR